MGGLRDKKGWKEGSTISPEWHGRMGGRREEGKEPEGWLELEVHSEDELDCFWGTGKLQRGSEKDLSAADGRKGSSATEGVLQPRNSRGKGLY